MKNRKTVSKQSFNQQAQTYDVDKNGFHARQQYTAILEKIATLKFTNILDVGFGTGEILKQLSVNYPNVNYFGVDISEKMQWKAEEKLKGIAQLDLGDAEKLPYGNNLFELLICNDSFHHYPNPQRVISEFYRVIKKGGHLLVSDYWKPFPIRNLMNIFIPYSKDGDVRIYSQREIIGFLKEKGFENLIYSKINSAFIVVANK